MMQTGRMRDNGHELKPESQREKFRLDVRITFTLWRPVKQWDKLPREFLDSPPLPVPTRQSQLSFEHAVELKTS